MNHMNNFMNSIIICWISFEVNQLFKHTSDSDLYLFAKTFENGLAIFETPSVFGAVINITSMFMFIDVRSV